jgi:glycosyltransferase involved in cell wall biosynthesis
VVGKTHPELVRREGEAYRHQLWQLVKSRGLQQHVEFVDEYLTQAQIVDYLLASDVYVTPYLDPSQITSGTLAYALGAGKAIVSTPYLHAVEVLSAERGILVPFRSETALAEATLRILGDPKLKRRLEHGAYAYGRETAWPRVGERMLTILRSAASQPDARAHQDRVLASAIGT